jgi:hypothetical protein
MNKILSGKLNYLIIISVFLLFQLPFLDSVRRIIVDENWYSNVAYNFAMGKGFINTNVGSYGGDICFLYPLIEGTFFYIFGTSLFAARFVSIIAGVISLFGIIMIYEQLKVKWQLKYFSVFLLIFSYNYFLIFRCARPEALTFMFFIWAFFFCVKYWDSDRKIYVFLQAAFSGLAFLIHPWGFAFALLFGVNSLIMSYKRKDYKIALIYLAGAVLLASILLFNTVIINNISFDTLVMRFGHRTTVSGSPHSIFSKIADTFFSLFEKYNFKSGRLYILLFHAFISFYGITFKNKNINIFRISIIQLSLVLITVFFYNGGGIEYMLHFIFFFTFLNTALILNELTLSPKISKVIIVLAALFFINNISGIFIIEKKEYGNPYSEVMAAVEKQVPKSSVVLSPIEMWFACRESEFYNSNTMWDFQNYENINSLLDSKRLNYIIKVDGVLISQTEENLQAIDKYITENGVLTFTMQTKNYGNISIWKVKN